MRAPILSLLRSLGLRRLASIVLWASIVGVVVGYSLATLADDVSVGGAAATATDTTTVARSGSTPSRPRSGPTVLHAVLERASTASGRRRGRARVTVTARIRNRSDRRRVAPAPPVLLVGDRRVKPDPAVKALANGLLDPVPPHRTVTGVLRFETAGAVTARLLRLRRARLRIDGRTLALRITE